jgi:predicted nucleic acid-binding protein
MRGIADTGFIVAFANRRDRYFPWAHGLAEKVSMPLLTCEAVVAEAAYLLSDSALVLRFLETGLIKLDFNLSDHQQELSKLAKRYADRSPDLADLCLIRMSELNPKMPILTVDQDFTVYRRNGKESIPDLMPPNGN